MGLWGVSTHKDTHMILLCGYKVGSNGDKQSRCPHVLSSSVNKWCLMVDYSPALGRMRMPVRLSGSSYLWPLVRKYLPARLIWSVSLLNTEVFRLVAMEIFFFGKEEYKCHLKPNSWRTAKCVVILVLVLFSFLQDPEIQCNLMSNRAEQLRG